jgi:hypothetical protein
MLHLLSSSNLKEEPKHLQTSYNYCLSFTIPTNLLLLLPIIYNITLPFVTFKSNGYFHVIAL